MEKKEVYLQIIEDLCEIEETNIILSTRMVRIRNRLLQIKPQNNSVKTVPLSVVEEVLFSELEHYMKRSSVLKIINKIANKKAGL